LPVAAHPVDDALDRRFGGLRVLDEPNDPRERRLGADRARRDEQQPVGVDRSAGDALARRLGDRQALAGDERLVDVAAAFAHLAVDRHALAGTNDHQVAHRNGSERHVDVASIAAYQRALGAQRVQGADRLGGLALGARLEPLAEQDQGDQRGRGLEVKVSARAAQELEHRQPVRGAGAERDQQVHVAGERLERLPARAIEARPEPELDDRRERELDPAGQRPVRAERQAAHRREQRHAQGGGSRDRPPLRQSEARARTLDAALHGLVACRGDRFPERVDVDARDDLDVSTLGREVDRCREHARNLGKRLLDARDARGAGHALDAEIDLAAGDFVARLLDRLFERLQRDRGCDLERRDLGCEVDRRGVDARHRGEGLLDPRDARCAGHPGDRQAQLALGARSAVHRRGRNRSRHRRGLSLWSPGRSCGFP
jgi:hypothetical protein